jgi:hypothetical protein
MTLQQVFFVIFVTVVIIDLIILDIKADKINKEIINKEQLITAFVALDKSIKKLNDGFKDHEHRLDILEDDHPDTDIDYGTVDDEGNITEVWFQGKRYVPEDKVEYIRYDRMYKNLGGNGMTEQLLKRAERLDYIYSTGLISIATYRRMVDELLQEELTHNDT